MRVCVCVCVIVCVLLLVRMCAAYISVPLSALHVGICTNNFRGDKLCV